jgi:hypothetical protein
VSRGAVFNGLAFFGAGFARGRSGAEDNDPVAIDVAGLGGAAGRVSTLRSGDTDACADSGLSSIAFSLFFASIASFKVGLPAAVAGLGGIEDAFESLPGTAKVLLSPLGFAWCNCVWAAGFKPSIIASARAGHIDWNVQYVFLALSRTPGSASLRPRVTPFSIKSKPFACSRIFL